MLVKWEAVFCNTHNLNNGINFCDWLKFLEFLTLHFVRSISKYLARPGWFGSWTSYGTKAWEHRPYSRQVTEWMKCDVVIHPPHTVNPKAGNVSHGDQWAIKYHCQNDSSTIALIVRDLVHWNFVTSENITHVCTSWKSLLIYVLQLILFLFIRHSLHCN